MGLTFSPSLILRVRVNSGTPAKKDTETQTLSLTVPLSLCVLVAQMLL